MKTTFYTLMLLLALTACKKTESPDNFAYASDTIAVEDANYEMAAPVANEAKFKESEYRSDNAPLPPPPPLSDWEDANQSKIIKNANLNFQTSNVDATAKKVQDAVKKYKGLVISDVESKEGYTLTRNLRIRVPSANFEPFIAVISQGVNYFDRKEISSEDVTEQFVDSEARLKTKRVLEARYLELLKKATKVSEMLEIESQISNIREEIEAHEGHLKYLRSQVAMSTLNISFYKTTVTLSGETESYGSKMGNALADGFNALSSFFLGLLNMWPFILIFVIVFVIIRKKIKKRRNAK